MANLKRAYERQFHYVYQTTNLVNGMYYIGLHSDDTLDNNYLGSGRYFKFALTSYGKDNFTKVILKVFETRQEASDYEKEIVTQEVIDDPISYNLCGGGDNGGIGITRSAESNEKNRQAHLGRIHNEATRELCRQIMVDEHIRRANDKSTYVKIKQSRNTAESKKKTSQQALSQWSNPEIRSKINKAIQAKANTPEFKAKSSYTGHRRWHEAKNVIKLSCRWCAGEKPTWDISHLPKQN